MTGTFTGVQSAQHWKGGISHQHIISAHTKAHQGTALQERIALSNPSAWQPTQQHLLTRVCGGRKTIGAMPMYTNGVQFLSARPNNDTPKRGAVPVAVNSQITEGKLHQHE
jgi:hypothetical protein